MYSELLPRWVHFHFLSFKLRRQNEKNSLYITVSKWHRLRHSITFSYSYIALLEVRMWYLFEYMLDFVGLSKYNNILIYKITEDSQ